MPRIKIHTTGIAEKTGLKGIDPQSQEVHDHVAVHNRRVILVDDVEKLLEIEPGVTVRQLLELTE